MVSVYLNLRITCMVLTICVFADTLAAFLPAQTFYGYLWARQLKKRYILQLFTLACHSYISPTLLHYVFFFAFFPKILTVLSLLFLVVPSASMTRLARSRTASLTSAGSVEGSRSRACTNSDSAEGVGAVSQTMEVSCWGAIEKREEEG